MTYNMITRTQLLNSGQALWSGTYPFLFQVDTSLADAPVDLINQFCTLDPYESTEGCNYIDLIKNEEKYTGYQVRFRILY